MSIEKVKGYFEGVTPPKMQKEYPAAKHIRIPEIHDSTTFTSRAKAPKDLQEFLLDKMPWYSKLMIKIHSGMGEIQNQLINACGTGMVAPIFIMYNPLSDKDQNTKTYTAMRQPISAILAVATQTAIVIPFNKLIQRLSDVGYFASDQNATFFPSDDYIKPLVRKENKGKYTNFIFYQKNKDEFKDAISQYRKEHFTSKLVNMIKDDKIIFNTTNGFRQSTEEMPAAEFKELYKKTIDSIIKDEEQLKLDVVEKKLPKKLARDIFYHDHPEEVGKILDTLENVLRGGYRQSTDIKEEENLAGIDKKTYKEFDKTCKEMIKDLEKNGKKDPSIKGINEKLVNIVKELKRSNIDASVTSLQGVLAKVTQMSDTLKTVKEMKSTEEIINYVNGVITRRLTAIDGALKPLKEILAKLQGTSYIKVQDAQRLIDEAIEQSDASVALELKDSGKNVEMNKTFEYKESSGARLRAKIKSIPDGIAKQLQKAEKANISALKRWTGLAVSLAILPATCWLLNRIYPWAMDRLFPSLSNNEKPEKKAEAAK